MIIVIVCIICITIIIIIICICIIIVIIIMATIDFMSTLSWSKKPRELAKLLCCSYFSVELITLNVYVQLKHYLTSALNIHID